MNKYLIFTVIAFFSILSTPHVHFACEGESDKKQMGFSNAVFDADGNVKQPNNTDEVVGDTIKTTHKEAKITSIATNSKQSKNNHSPNELNNDKQFIYTFNLSAIILGLFIIVIGIFSPLKKNK